MTLNEGKKSWVDESARDVLLIASAIKYGLILYENRRSEHFPRPAFVPVETDLNLPLVNPRRPQSVLRIRRHRNETLVPVFPVCSAPRPAHYMDMDDIRL